MVSHTIDKDLPKPDIIITSPAGEPQGLQSTVSLGGGTPAQTSDKVYRTFIEHQQWIFSQNVLPQCPTKSLLQLMWCIGLLLDFISYGHYVLHLNSIICAAHLIGVYGKQFIPKDYHRSSYCKEQVR
jgi:hypothetical protein